MPTPSSAGRGTSRSPMGLGTDASTLTKVGSGTLTLAPRRPDRPGGDQRRHAPGGHQQALGAATTLVGVAAAQALDLNGVTYSTASPLSLNGQASRTGRHPDQHQYVAEATYGGVGRAGHRRQYRQRGNITLAGSLGTSTAHADQGRRRHADAGRRTAASPATCWSAAARCCWAFRDGELGQHHRRGQRRGARLQWQFGDDRRSRSIWRAAATTVTNSVSELQTLTLGGSGTYALGGAVGGGTERGPARWLSPAASSPNKPLSGASTCAGATLVFQRHADARLRRLAGQHSALRQQRCCAQHEYRGVGERRPRTSPTTAPPRSATPPSRWPRSTAPAAWACERHHATRSAAAERSPARCPATGPTPAAWP